VTHGPGKCRISILFSIRLNFEFVHHFWFSNPERSLSIDDRKIQSPNLSIGQCKGPHRMTFHLARRLIILQMRKSEYYSMAFGNISHFPKSAPNGARLPNVSERSWRQFARLWIVAPFEYGSTTIGAS
jgi:hypothetical protein